MGTMRLDIDTADRILDGLVDPADAPPGYQAMVALLAAARPASVPVRTPEIAAGRPSAPLRSRRRPMIATTPFRPRLSILAAAVILGGASGAAYAAGVPAAASSTAQHVLQSLGVTPGAKAHTGASKPVTHGTTVSTLARTTTATGAAKGAAVAAAASEGRSHAGAHHGDGAGGSGGDASTKSHGHGSTISALAHSTSGTAGAKGAIISAAASGGKSHAGQHGHNGKSTSAPATHAGGNGKGQGHTGS